MSSSIPHRRQFYQYALSGIFTEALAMESRWDIRHIHG